MGRRALKRSRSRLREAPARRCRIGGGDLQVIMHGGAVQAIHEATHDDRKRWRPLARRIVQLPLGPLDLGRGGVGRDHQHQPADEDAAIGERSILATVVSRIHAELEEPAIHCDPARGQSSTVRHVVRDQGCSVGVSRSVWASLEVQLCLHNSRKRSLLAGSAARRRLTEDSMGRHEDDRCDRGKTPDKRSHGPPLSLVPSQFCHIHSSGYPTGCARASAAIDAGAIGRSACIQLPSASLNQRRDRC